PICSVAAPEAPRFVWELPDGGIRERLEPVLEMRALLPLATVTSRIQALNVLNSDGKTVARLFLDEGLSLCRESDESDGSPEPLGDLLRVQPVKGYDHELADVLEVVKKQLRLRPADDLFKSAMDKLGLTPGNYSSKVNVSLRSGTRADDATRMVLEDIFATLRANEDGTRRDIDSEFLHDFRVSVRRTRSALNQMKRVFPADSVAHFRSEFRWLQQLTGPARDLDVYLLGFSGYQAQLPDSAPDNLESLRRFLEAKKRQAHAELVEGLDSERYAQLLSDWESFLSKPPDPKDENDAPDAVLPVEEAAGKRIWNMYRRVTEAGAAITDDSPAEHLHELRKDCKELRYLLEFFQSLFPTERVSPVLKSLKKLQDNLGEFQDCEVQSENLRGFGREMMEQAQASADTLMSMGILVDNIAEAQAKARAEFYERFSNFACEDNRKLFRDQFKRLKGVAAS
ncbi:MAG: CHAD domain-containing protein, partial [Chloroflexota bacterium]